MYVSGDDNERLKTKIVATVGPYRDEIFDLKGKPLSFAKDPKTFWPAFLREFNHDCGYMIDVIRLNMSYFEKKMKEKQKTKPEKKKEENERNVIRWLRDNTDITKHVALLGDLPGPKLRLHDVADDVKLNRGQSFKFLFRNRREDGHPCICLHEKAVGDVDTGIAQKVRRSLLERRGVVLSVGDGTPTLRVSQVKGDSLICITEDAGPISNRKGVTFRGVELDLPSFTTADEEALDFLIDNGLDWTRGRTTVTGLRSVLAFVAVSFVRKQDDILKVKQYAEEAVYKRLLHATRRRGTAEFKEDLRTEARLLSPAIIAKIETKQAWNNIDQILDAADGAMVARGDLALQIGARDVPGVQKHLIRLCNARGKPVITATEMLASMENNPEPTRAEANDVFNAVLDGSDAVMLSGETSKGKYPYHAVKAMCDIALAAEKHFASFGAKDTIDRGEVRRLNEQRIESFLVSAEEIARPVKARLDKVVLEAMHADDKWREGFYRYKARKEGAQDTTDRVSMSACILANARDTYRAILALTTSGRTARMISRFRPEVIIIGGAHDWINARKLILSFGVCPVNCGEVSPKTGEKYGDPEEAARECCRLAKAEGLLEDGDTIILSAGTPLFCPGSANLVQIIGVD